MYSEVLYASPGGRDCVTYTHWLVLKLKVGRECHRIIVFFRYRVYWGVERLGEVDVPGFQMMRGSSHRS